MSELITRDRHGFGDGTWPSAIPQGMKCRRRFLNYGLVAGLAALTGSITRAAALPPLTIGTTPVFLDDDVAFLRDWQAYLQRELGRPVTFVQRRSYRDVSELLLAEKLDAAWICGYP